MNITLAEWNTIKSAVEDAKDAIGKLEDTLFILAKDKPEAEAIFLMELARQVSDLAGDKHLIPYFYTPQSEWLGGDSEDPKNFTYREPHIVGNFPKRIQ